MIIITQKMNMYTDCAAKKRHKATFLSRDFNSKRGSDDSHCHFGEAWCGGLAMTCLLGKGVSPGRSKTCFVFRSSNIKSKKIMRTMSKKDDELSDI